MSTWRMSRMFLGSKASIAEARRFVTYFLKNWPQADTAELIVSELATNAVRHSDSGRFGGRFVVTLMGNTDIIWLGVQDEGGASTPALSTSAPDEEGGHGLILVAHLSVAWGVSGTAQGRTVWAVIHPAHR
ncbi:ATP-binding protein [Nonomuraea sp. NBC_01738]|uniref:ATP-binding protein n=1 Tax=Nonomuraea sp. NBC_01738 TaxID=2976003 RepID=UPI002E15507A|nr:ATP-binding protein [Nonomuraea sp. NBC_01738]